MAAEDTPRVEAEDDPSATAPCSPCRGAGKIVSHLGGAREEVTCPWCEGTGRLIPEHDAQARFRGEGDAAQPGADQGRPATSTAPTVRSDD